MNAVNEQRVEITHLCCSQNIETDIFGEIGCRCYLNYEGHHRISIALVAFTSRRLATGIATVDDQFRTGHILRLC